MPREYSLDLLHNSIDSLNESINYYKEALSDESKYKFCIILFFHFMELILKHLVEIQNPLLCYVKPYSEQINKENTITWNQAIQLLINSGKKVDLDLIKQFKILSKLRNNIIHFKFTYNTSEIRKMLIDIVAGLRKLYKEITSNDFYDEVETDTQELLSEIEDEYNKDLHLARNDAIEEADGDEIYDCIICLEEKTVIKRDNGYYCYLCKEIDKIRECVQCYRNFRESEMSYFGENTYGDAIYLCEYCMDRLDRE
jgi:hypothetical protein